MELHAFQQNEASAFVYFAALDSDDGTEQTGLSSFTVRISKAGAAFGDGGGSVTELEAGIYKYTFGGTDLGTVGLCALSITKTGTKNVRIAFRITTKNPQNFAVAGDQMDLIDTPNTPAINAIQNGLATATDISDLETHGDSTWATATGFAEPGDQMDLINAPNATAITAIQSGLATSSAMASAFTEIKGATFDGATDSLEALRNRGDAAWITATGFAVAGSAMTLTAGTITSIQSGLATIVSIQALADYGDLNWATATGFAEPGDQMDLVDMPNTPAINAIQNGLATNSDLDALETHGDAAWATATGFAEPGDQMDLVNAPNATAVTAIQSGLATSSGMAAAFTEIKGATFNSATDTMEAIRDRGDAAWLTATGFAVPGSAMTLTGGTVTTIQSGLATTANVASVGTAVDTLDDKLDALTETSSGTYRFKAAALTQAPAGEGGGGGDPLENLVPGDYEPGTAGAMLGSLVQIVGTGSVLVDHDYGGADAMRYTTTDGAPIGNASLRVYPADDYAAGRRDLTYVVGQARTGPDGRWISAIALNPGDYTLLAHRNPDFGPNTVNFTVE